MRLVAHHSCAWMEAEACGLREKLKDEFPCEAPELADALCFSDMNTAPVGAPPTPWTGWTRSPGEPEILLSCARVHERLAAAKRQPM
ncbi:hypothetical protein [Streptomyces sp. NPDC002209]|uniref:hypothetical protein n=1 Tax=Streptomyces sp. NPDC002209 TaxID=3364638 RepID=UPI0036AA9C04